MCRQRCCALPYACVVVFVIESEREREKKGRFECSASEHNYIIAVAFFVQSFKETLQYCDEW